MDKQEYAPYAKAKMEMQERERRVMARERSIQIVSSMGYAATPDALISESQKVYEYLVQDFITPL